MKKTSDGDNICALCRHGTPIFTGSEVLCRKYGLVSSAACCRRFAADPLKRVVKPMPPLPKLDISE